MPETRIFRYGTFRASFSGRDQTAGYVRLPRLYVLNSPQRYAGIFSRACSTSRVKEILVEEYNTGYEFNLMSWVMDGQVYILSIADREKTGTGTRDVPISTRNVYPSRLIGDVYEPAKNILEKFIAATGQTEGHCLCSSSGLPGRRSRSVRLRDVSWDMSTSS